MDRETGIGRGLLLAALSGWSLAGCGGAPNATGDLEAAAEPACDPGNGGITLPEGFCALVVADEVGRARHLAVAANGDIYVALRDERGGGGGGVVALRDTTGDGKADVRAEFDDAGGTGLSIHDGWLYFAPDWGVLRWRMEGGRLAPQGPPDTVVAGLPGPQTQHAAKTAVIDSEGRLYVNMGAPSNTCQERDRTAGSPGQDPCPRLATRGGIWVFAANRAGQTQEDGERFATGIRNGFALAIRPSTGQLYAVQHGRDNLHQDWGELFTEKESAEKPAEEMLAVDRGDDFGWPYCYYDPELGEKVLAPEYGGDGREVGRCADKEGPVVAFPGHWGPNDLLFYTGEMFPERYRGGAFVAFHGSWNRAPLPQAGYNVAFVPFRGDEPVADGWEVFADGWEVFADGFAGGEKDPRNAAHRPSGLAQGPDGSLYIADDQGGRIWRVLYEP